MVYGGKPSTGCYLCRKRKVKCDEAFPQCRNCIVYGKPCPGYRPDAIFRNETQKVEKLVKKINNSPSSQDSGSSSSPQEVTVSPRSRTGSQCSPPLQIYHVADSTWEDRAICYFFEQYTTYGESDDIVTHLGFLPSLYALCRESPAQGSPGNSCLQQAVDAASLLTLGNEVKAPSLIVRARSTYGMALRGLRHALESRSEAVKDETFAAVVLLSLFEDITGERNGLNSSHTEGFQFLMKLRGESQLKHKTGRDLFNFAYAHTHIEILALGDKPRFNSEWIVNLLNHSDPVHRLMVTSSKVSEVLIEASSAAKAQHVEGDIFAKLAEWIEIGKLLDMELAEWSQSLPDYWLPLIVYSQTGEPLISYHRISIGAIWNYYRAVRIVLQRLVLEVRRILNSVIQLFGGIAGEAVAQEEATMLEVIQEMISDICRSIPFSLGEIDARGNPVRLMNAKSNMKAFHGYSLLWPLWYVLTCGLATPEQAQQVRTVLAHVGSALGIKLALTLAQQGEEPYPSFTDLAFPLGQSLFM